MYIAMKGYMRDGSTPVPMPFNRYKEVAPETPEHAANAKYPCPFITILS